MANIGEKTSTQRLIVELYSMVYGEELTFREILRRLYVDQNMSIKQVAEKLHVGVGTVHKWLKDEKIAARKMIWQ
jgi:DNA-binding transcriptional regulator YiaG